MRTRVGNKKLNRRIDHKRLRSSVRAALDGGRAKQILPARWAQRPEPSLDPDIIEREDTT